MPRMTPAVLITYRQTRPLGSGVQRGYRNDGVISMRRSHTRKTDTAPPFTGIRASRFPSSTSSLLLKLSSIAVIRPGTNPPNLSDQSQEQRTFKQHRTLA